jgi:transcriptional regulatory protein RtcR
MRRQVEGPFVEVNCATLRGAAGRALFAVSRTGKASINDAERLRKYLGRFGLD